MKTKQAAKNATGESTGDTRTADDEDRARSRRSATAPKRVATKKTPKSHDEDDQADAEGGTAGDEDENAEDEEDDSDAAALPVVRPRVFTFEAGATMIGRGFRFNIPLQQDSSFPRLGFLAGVELFPMLLMSRGWYRPFGLAASYESEVVGQATVSLPSGSSVNTPMKQTHWFAEVRYVLAVVDRLALAPAVGFAGSAFTLSTNAPIMASSCTTTQTTACLPDTDAMFLSLGAHARVAATLALGFSIDGNYLLSLNIKNRPANEIGYEARTSASGFEVQVGATYMINDWFAVRAGIPYRHLTYVFHSPPATPYQTATEVYYGATASVLVFTK